MYIKGDKIKPKNYSVKKAHQLGIETVYQEQALAEKQGAAIRRAMYFDADLVILDESTMGLSLQEVDKVLNFITSIKEQRKSCVYISHNISNVYPVSDRFVAMDRGKVVGRYNKDQISLDELNEELILVTKIGIPAIVVTIGMQFFIRGLSNVLSQGSALNMNVGDNIFYRLFAGILDVFRMRTWWPTMGEGYLMMTVATVFVGGTSMFGGEATILGTFIGAFLIGSLEAGIVAAGLSGFWTRLIYGLLILVAVTIHTVMNR